MGTEHTPKSARKQDRGWAFSGLHRGPEPVQGAERLEPGTDHDLRLDAEGHGRDVGRVEGEIEEDVVNHRQESIALLLQPGPSGALWSAA
jgi:hypothetical protein